MRKNSFQKKLMILNLSLGITSLFVKLTKLVRNHLREKQQNPSLSVSEKSTRFGSDMEQLSSTIDIH